MRNISSIEIRNISMRNFQKFIEIKFQKFIEKVSSVKMIFRSVRISLRNS